MRQHRLHRLNAGPEWGTAKMGKIGVQHCWVLDLVDLLGQETQALGIPFFLVLLHNCEAPLLCLLEVLAGKVSSICPFQPPCHVPYPSFGEGSFPPHSSLQEEGSTERESLSQLLGGSLKRPHPSTFGPSLFSDGWGRIGVFTCPPLPTAAGRNREALDSTPSSLASCLWAFNVFSQSLYVQEEAQKSRRTSNWASHDSRGCQLMALLR